MPTATREYEGTLDEILEHRDELVGHRLRLQVLDADPVQIGVADPDFTRAWTSKELMALPKGRRRKIIAYQVEKAIPYYTNSPEVREWLESNNEVYDYYDQT